MSNTNDGDQTATGTDPQAQNQTQGEPATGNTTTGTDLAAEVEKWKSLARKHEDRAKVNADAQKQLDQLKQQSMSDQEKAIEAAKAEVRKLTLAEVGGQLVDAEIRAVAAGRLGESQLAVLLQGLNRSAFLNDDGSVNKESVTTFVDGIAPKTDNSALTFHNVDQGTRGSMLPLNGDPLLAELRKKLGISS